MRFRLLRERTEAFWQFWRFFGRYTLHVREVIAGLILTLNLGGLVVARVEEMSIGDGIYFAFITGLSIGYGDITPVTMLGRVLSIGIGMIGMIFTGLVIAIATHALTDATRTRLGRKPLHHIEDT